MHDHHAALNRLGLELLHAGPAGKYRGLSIVGATGYVSGHIGLRDGLPTIAGIVGGDLSVEDGRIAARDAALAALGTLEDELGSLNRIVSIPRVFGMVHATPDFAQHPTVIDGASELLLEVLGPDVGTHARSAVGMSSLPFGAAVELELTVIIDGQY